MYVSWPFFSYDNFEVPYVSLLFCQYIRVEHQMDTKVLWELLKAHWKIPEPKLIISITGGAKRLFIKSRLMNSFRRGLINAVTAAGMSPFIPICHALIGSYSA